jgi:hypothetical protein
LTHIIKERISALVKVVPQISDTGKIERRYKYCVPVKVKKKEVGLLEAIIAKWL